MTVQEEKGVIGGCADAIVINYTHYPETYPKLSVIRRCRSARRGMRPTTESLSTEETLQE